YPNFSGGGAWVPPDFWQPIAGALAAKPALLQRGLHVDSRTLVRLRPGVDSARAAAAMHVLEQRLAAAYPVDQGHWTQVELTSMSDAMFGPSDRRSRSSPARSRSCCSSPARTWRICCLCERASADASWQCAPRSAPVAGGWRDISLPKRS